jgi:LysM repeat protein
MLGSMSDRVLTEPPAAPEPPPSTAPADEGQSGRGPDTIDAAHAVCPYLLASGGDWRYLAPAREHTCTAVDPPSPVAADKQRRLCLVEGHVDCATYMAARQVREVAGQGGSDRGPARWPIPRTAPVIVDRGRPSLASLRLDRSVVQAGLVALMIIAFVVLALARFTAPDPGPSGGAPGTPAPSTAPSATPGPGSSRTPSPSASPTPSSTAAASPSAGPSTSPVASPSASVATTTETYTVRSGDTLSGIAVRFGTSVAALRQLNGIEDPSLLRVGQVLRIP